MVEELYCPNCNKPLKVLYDSIHDETYCKHCGIILRCPPNCDITTPEVIHKNN